MPRRAKPRIAIAYDFDGTLAPGNMQERDFIPALGMKTGLFWKQVKEMAKDHDMDEILAYLQLMLDQANARETPIDRDTFVNYGRNLEFFPGVEEWFPRMSSYGQAVGASIEHYIISSGLREMIEGTRISRYLTRTFASGFRYDQHGVAKWPALAVNYTNKTQYLFRINKGIPNSYDNSSINKYMPLEDRPIPFENVIYIGDGETDIPAMKMVTYQGGRAIAVYPPRKKGAKQKAQQLILEERASAAFLADYREGKALDRAVCAAIDAMAARARFIAAAGPRPRRESVEATV